MSTPWNRCALLSEILSQQAIEFMANGDELNTSNCFSRLRLKSLVQLSIASEVAFAAGPFDKFSIAALREVEPSDISDIANVEGVRLSSDDCLLSSILELGCNIRICLVLFDSKSQIQTNATRIDLQNRRSSDAAIQRWLSLACVAATVTSKLPTTDGNNSGTQKMLQSKTTKRSISAKALVILGLANGTNQPVVDLPFNL
jgi:hypothetical protein